MEISRREIIKLGLSGSGALLLPWRFAQPAAAQPRQTIQPFELPFRIPPILDPVCSDATTNYYEITMQKAPVEILPGLTTEIWGFNGILPGPTIKQRKGRQSVVRFINKLGTDANGESIDTTIHLCGMVSLPQYDGYPEDLIPPDFYKDYYYPNDRAATYWYHDNVIANTARNVYMGLAGMYIVEDDFEEDLHLPKGPEGEFDLPLILQDKLFTPDGSLLFQDHSQRGLWGDVILVNGVPCPRMEVANRKYRFRCLNASVSRAYLLMLSTGDDLIVIGTDGGLMSVPVPTKALRIGVGERYEFIIDFSKYPIGTQVVLQNPAFPANLGSSAYTQAILRFDVVRQEDDESTIPTRLRVSPPLLASTVKTRTFRFGRTNKWTINGRTWDKNRVDASPDLDDLEIWNLVNTGSWVHPVHIHSVDLQILARNGKSPLPYEQGWKDVVWLNELDTVQVISRFGPHSGKYLMHSYDLVQKDYGMMTQFEVGGTNGADPVYSAPAKPLPAPSFASTKPLPVWYRSSK